MTGDDPYRDGALYDLEYADHTEDVAFYADRARAACGTVLELGCGTGRLTLPMARAGVHVVGVDASLPMLDRLREKLAREPEDVRSRITLHAAPWTELEPTVDVALVLWPFNALHHCADRSDLVAVLSAARRWTRPGAHLVLDGYLPDRALYDRDPGERFEPRTFRDPLTGEPIESWEQGWWVEETRTHHVVYVYRSPSGVERRIHLRLHMAELADLRQAAGAAGWGVVGEWSDFRGRPLEPRSLKWVATLVNNGLPRSGVSSVEGH